MLDGGGKSKKIYTYIDDISEGELLIMQKGKFGEIYHLSINKLISINKLVSKICRVTEKKFEKVVKFGPRE